MSVEKVISPDIGRTLLPEQGERRLFLVGRSALEHEALVAIAAFDKTLLVNLEPDTRMAKRGTAGNIGRAITRDTMRSDNDGFRSLDHAALDSNAVPGSQGSN